MLIFGGVFVFLVRRLRAFDADKLENLFPAVNTKSENLFPKKRGEFAQPAHGANSPRSWLMALLGIGINAREGIRCDLPLLARDGCAAVYLVLVAFYEDAQRRC